MMSQAFYNELRHDLSKATTKRQAFAVVKKFLLGISAGFIPSCPPGGGSRLDDAFRLAVKNLFGWQIQGPTARIASTSANCYCAQYPEDGTPPQITWLYFDDMRKGVVIHTYDSGDAGYFSLRDYWGD